MARHLRATLPPLLVALVLTACGGGGSGQSDRGSASQQTTAVNLQEPNAPQATGNTATDGLNWFNFRRQQLGMQNASRNASIDIAAQGHSDYQRINNTVTHEQTPGQPGFTGTTVGDRLAAAGYTFSPRASYAYGEVISATADASGVKAAEDLIAAIYHRFVIFEPMFKEAGAGAATGNGSTYFTVNFTANGLTSGLGTGKIITYPFSDQQRVARNFFSDNEAPDPVPDRNEVGYPISVHADITSSLTTQSFTIRPRGGTPLAVKQLTSTLDPLTPDSVAAIIPLDALQAATTYDVQFTGTVDGANVNHSWSFTTQ